VLTDDEELLVPLLSPVKVLDGSARLVVQSSAPDVLQRAQPEQIYRLEWNEGGTVNQISAAMCSAVKDNLALFIILDQPPNNEPGSKAYQAFQADASQDVS
jgi:hypothetical protein